MGNTEQDKAKAMKRYIREVFVPEYAKNFNKELSASDIKFYGKIHFNHSRSNNQLNMHSYLIISRKGQANKKKLSPLTNHKETKNGIIKGIFYRVNMFQQAELGFDELFHHNRQRTESFKYDNVMRHSSISERLKLEELEFQSRKRKTEINQDSNQEDFSSSKLVNKKAKNQVFNANMYIGVTQENKTYINPSFNKKYNQIFGSLISRISLGMGPFLIPNEQILKSKKKQRKWRRL